MDRCVNCGISTGHCNTLGRRPLHDETILSVIQQWLTPQSVSSSDCVCQACWDLAQSPHVDDQRRPLGHRNICLRCGPSYQHNRYKQQVKYVILVGWLQTELLSCNCIVGKRTVGCCAHIMCIIWYLSWARYQDHIVPPAQFLDDILIIIKGE